MLPQHVLCLKKLGESNGIKLWSLKITLGISYLLNTQIFANGMLIMERGNKRQG